MPRGTKTRWKSREGRPGRIGHAGDGQRAAIGRERRGAPRAPPAASHPGGFLMPKRWPWRARRTRVQINPGGDAASNPAPLRHGAPANPSPHENGMHGIAAIVVQARDVHGDVVMPWPSPQEHAMPRELPAEIPAFVGRSSDLAQLDQARATPGGPHIVLITGSPGVGKTTLAVHYAHRVRELFPDGQLFINLHGFDPGAPLASATALEHCLRALGVPAPSIPDDPDRRAALYRTSTADKRLLLVADNAASTEQVRALIPAGRSSLVLATSRNRLENLTAHLSGRLRLDLLAPDQAARLISSILHGFRTGDDPQHIEDLARLCANLPLALRIAAERAAARPLMPLREVIEDLRAESSLWQALSGEDELETEAVRTVFAWSYRAQPPAAARSFRLLALHPGTDFGLEVAGAILEEPLARTRALLDALNGAHLIDQTGFDRYQFHDLLRAYATSLIDDEHDPHAPTPVIERAVTWYLDGARAATSATQNLLNPHPPGALVPHSPRFTGPDQAREWFTRERANLLAALEAAHRHDLHALTWQLAAALRPLYAAASTIDDWRRAGELGLDSATRENDPNARGQMLTMLAIVEHATGDFKSAIARHNEASEHYRTADDPARHLQSINSIGLIHLERRDLETAETHFNRTLELARTAGLEIWAALAHDNLAATHKEAGRLEIAAALAHQAIDAYRRLEADGRIMAMPLLHLARIHRETHRLDLAERYLTEAERALPDPETHLPIGCDIVLERAELENAQALYEKANHTYWQCVQLQRPLGHRAREAAAYNGIGRTLARTGQPAQAADFHRRALALRRQLPDPYLLAATLADLADALEQHGVTCEPSDHRAEAQRALAQLTDPRAEQLRRSLANR